jgi:hypothetical protein
MAGKPGRSGRPTIYTQELADKICTELAKGKSVLGISKMAGMPSEGTIRLWALDDVGSLDGKDGFYSRYARARDFGIDHHADLAIELADKAKPGKKIRETVTRCWKCEGTGKVKADTDTGSADQNCKPCCGTGKITSREVITGDMIERARLQVDTRKWYTSKLAPKRYGDRLAHRFEDENGKDRPFQLSDVDRIIEEGNRSDV